MEGFNELLIIFLTLLVVSVCILIVAASVYKRKREEFVRENSVALRMLEQINLKHTFLPVQCFDMTHSYDNRNYYDTVSPGDYLTYQLLYKHKAVTTAIANAAENAEHMKAYQSELAANSELGRFESAKLEKTLTSTERLLRKIWFSNDWEAVCADEQRLFEAAVKRPITECRISVTIYLTDIQGQYLEHKSSLFREPEIAETIRRIHNKDNGRFEDPALWQAITRVERAKVSNRMRFAVYNRDGNRCRKCGSTQDLEVDHIYPISKGGKTTFENLQTLCHNCNVQKSNHIELGAVPLRLAYKSYENLCPNCGIPLVKRRGTYSDFWGCPNYPKCRFTKNVTR